MRPFRVVRFSALLPALLAPIVWGAEPTWQEQQNLPPWARSILEEKSLVSTYALTTRINPYFLQGDFNGDGTLDLAVLIGEKATQQQGIAILHAGERTPRVVGAGRAVGNGGADFSWLDAWSVYVKQAVPQGAAGKKRPVLRGDALLVEKLESASGLIYWDGTAYRWYQQGD